jgi:GH25 family lysozyme M1 (1,4-beta-N-acetylmuramidase)
VTRGGRHRKLRQRTSIVSAALIIAAGLAVTVGLETASHTLTPAANAATAPLAGTDVSNLTTVSSWPDVASAGMAFTGVMAYDGLTVVNPSYNSQVNGALGQGLFVMPYIVADPLKIAGGPQFTQKAWPVIDGISGKPYKSGGQYLPIALDLEAQPSVTSSSCYTLNQTKMIAWIKAFIGAVVAKTGVQPIIYSNPNWWQACVGTTNPFSGDPLWIADYGVSSPAIPSGWAGYTFWQSSGSASVGGISGKADLDQFEGILTEKAGASGSFQLKTLNSLAGQAGAITYSADLPTGVSLNKTTGVLSWASTVAANRYTFTVTATGAAGTTVTPAAIPVTLDMHGSISLAVANRSATAGAPVVLGVGASGPDQSKGYAATLKATGLPTGLTMSSTGKITGWAAKPGTFKVSVTASDPLGGTGSASFTWTVRAAANSGTVGQVRQVGGTGKCLDDPSGKTANGTHVDLSTCNGKSNQKWTAAADNTLRTGGKCMEIVGDTKSSGAKLDLEPCNATHAAQIWQASTDGQLLNPWSGKCLDVPVASAANGTQPVIEPCANSTSASREHWLRPVAPILSGSGKCVAVSGSAVVLASCANTAAQHWQPKSDGTLRLSGKCLTESGTAASSVLSLGSCSGAAATKWKLVAEGAIATEIDSTASGRCVTAPSAGTRLVIAACANTPTGTWHVELHTDHSYPLMFGPVRFLSQLPQIPRIAS